jgi:hypothetical protein
VWLARDELELREVALKVVPREGKAGVRAEREAAAVARLRHPHCARVLALGRDDDHVYVAYEYVPGRTLREAMRAGALDDRSAVEAAAQVLEALAHAHHRGIVHRDVKPANILLEDADGISVRLLDFGLAQLEDASSLTASGDVPGTLSYIAPERLRGEEADGAADVWAVGVVLWEALAGAPPFWGASPVDTARMIAAGPAPLRKARPDLPRALTQAVDRALSLDPRRRPEPKQLAAQLRASFAETARRRARRPAVARRTVIERSGHAVLCAAYVAISTWFFPFFPGGWPAGLAVAAGLAALASPRAGLALALFVPLLPLGNVSLALTVVYLPVALLWLVLGWRDARHSLLFLAGPLLAPFGLLGLLPLVAERATASWRRAWQASAGVLAAALVAGLRGSPLPFDGQQPPHGLGIEGSEDPGAVASALLGAVTDHRLILIEAILLGAAAVALPIVRRRGLWAIAAFGAVLLAAGLLAPPLAGAGTPQALWLVLAAWALCAALAIPTLRRTVES